MTRVSASFDRLALAQPMGVRGRVASVRGLTVAVDDLPTPVGSQVSVRTRAGSSSPGEVVGFTHDRAVVMLLGQTAGVTVGDPVVVDEPRPVARVGDGLLGRVVDALARPIDGRGPVYDARPRMLSPDPIRPMQRRPIAEPLPTGVRAIDVLATLGRGQRVGIFAGPGVGKSTLLGQVSRGAGADVIVIALVGERGREVRDFIDHSLGADGLARSVVVVATGDESPLLRIRAALSACAAAEHFRDAGRDVLLVMDSITRFAQAHRQVGLSVGEPAATRGYTPGVFASLPLLLERAGAVEGSGSITGLYTVLVEGDDLADPIADAARGILDGHIILSRKLAQRSHYPAIDVLDSVSRVADAVSDAGLIAARRQILRLLAKAAAVEELVQIGAYARGSDAETDVALDFLPRISDLLRQGSGDRDPMERSRARAVQVALESGDAVQRRLKELGRPAAGR